MRGGGQDRSCDTQLSEKCLCLLNYITALLKQISLFDTALVITITKSFTSKFKKYNFWKFVNTIKEYFTPILNYTITLTKDVLKLGFIYILNNTRMPIASLNIFTSPWEVHFHQIVC